MKKYRKGVFCVVYSVQNKKIQYLLLHRKLHWHGWEFVKGGKKFLESLTTTAKREIKEETGLEIKFLKKMKQKGSFIYDKKSQEDWKAKGFRYEIFACLVDKKKTKIDKIEHDKHLWTTYNRALNLLRWSNQKKTLKSVNSFLKDNI